MYPEPFSKDMVDKIAPGYFDILGSGPDKLLLRSRNTGHIWKITREDDCIRLWHKHRERDSFHRHAVFITLEYALYEILYHDAYQLNGRRPLDPVLTRNGLVMPKPKKKNTNSKYKKKMGNAHKNTGHSGRTSETVDV